MMYKLSFGTKFKRDFKTIQKLGYPIDQLIWEQNDIQKEIKLTRTGAHSDLF
ncbi:MAG: hypothetical protein Q7J86_04195 [Bacteroidota bacterium]|nr:hypothetical protein [Bacteroidota bacterium]